MKLSVVNNNNNNKHAHDDVNLCKFCNMEITAEE